MTGCAARHNRGARSRRRRNGAAARRAIGPLRQLPLVSRRGHGIASGDDSIELESAAGRPSARFADIYLRTPSPKEVASAEAAEDTATRARRPPPCVGSEIISVAEWLRLRDQRQATRKAKIAARGAKRVARSGWEQQTLTRF
jgi:hypothetical protein